MIDLNSLRLEHKRFLAAHTAAVSTELHRSAEHGKAEVFRNPGFKPRSGDLQRATQARFVRTSNGGFVRLTNRLPYAGPIDKGSPAHVIPEIKAKREGGRLRFVGRNGAIVFRRAVYNVKHPGNRPYHFLRSATTAAAHNFEMGMSAAMRRIASSF